MVIRYVDAPRGAVKTRLSAAQASLRGTPGRCVPAERDELSPALRFEEAFIGLQGDLPVIPELGSVPGGQGRDGYSYALWEDINERIRPVLVEHGFSLRFRVRQDQGAVIVTAALVHVAGHREETELLLPVDGTGGKNSVQAVGSAVSYGKRYAASLLLNITTRGEDDDGRGGRSETGVISAAEVETIRSGLKVVKRSEERLVKALGITKLEDLPKARLLDAMGLIALRAVAS
jgi:hypothetical protein